MHRYISTCYNSDMRNRIDALNAVEARLANKGFWPLSDFWRGALESGWQRDKRIAVFRVGRQGGKSSVMVRAAVGETDASM